MNRLADETSPYLRQHADNPVDWYPWGPEAFAEARRLDRPVLLSVGYSACHWCHVMAHESFEDAATADVMNGLFVNVKVDREERPDVDAIYMEAVQAQTGRGGWPMTCFLTPDGQPFFGGTYFPRERFVELCQRVDAAWRQQRTELVEQAGNLTAALGQLGSHEPDAGYPSREAIGEAAGMLVGQHDTVWGGHGGQGGPGGAPKFPQASTIDFLLRWRSPNSLDAARVTLDAMASGGIYDHLGGGFARYSVDREWLVPHFEKMLYDNALLTRAYLHAWQLSGLPVYRQVVAETIGYVLRDLRHPDGGFFSAEDADSEGEEGRFYVWSLEDVRALGGEACVSWYEVTAEGNFEGHNILNRRHHRGDLLRPPEVEEGRARLFEARGHRVRPGLDDKCLTEWNALMLGALAEAAAAVGDESWLAAAVANGEFLLRELRRPDGRWLRSWQADGGSRHLAYAVDYAALVDAFVRLGEASGQARWVTVARETADEMLRLFWDPDVGGLFTTGDDAEQLITRTKDLMDNATPSANSLAAFGLLRLAALTGEARYQAAAEAILRLSGPLAVRHPAAFGHLLTALEFASAAGLEVAVLGDRADLVRAVHDRWLPHAVFAWGEPYDSPLFADRRDGVAYVCRASVCDAPVDTVEALGAQLDA